MFRPGEPVPGVVVVLHRDRISRETSTRLLELVNYVDGVFRVGTQVLRLHAVLVTDFPAEIESANVIVVIVAVTRSNESADRRGIPKTAAVAANERRIVLRK